jgi:hypothetical protein
MKRKAETGLPLPGLLLYYIMWRLVTLRLLVQARSIGKVLHHFFGENVAVGKLLADIYSQLWDQTSESKVLTRIAMNNRHDIDLLARAGESAVYAADLSRLKTIRGLVLPENGALLSYIDGLVACMNGQSNYHFHFESSVKTFFDAEGVKFPGALGGTIGEMCKKFVESGRELPAYVRQAFNIRGPSSINDLLMVKNPSTAPTFAPDMIEGPMRAGNDVSGAIVLISCSDGYLNVFGDYYIRTFRRNNSNIIHFHVLSDNVEATRARMTSLQKKYTDIGYSVEPIASRSQTYITLARFLICRDLMNYYRSDVLVSDIDFNADFDLNSITQEIISKEFDIGLCDLGCSLPWGKFAVGFSYFRVDNRASDVFLDLLSRYLTSLYAEGGFFSMDMAGVVLISEYMQARGDEFRMLDIGRLINLERMIRSMPIPLQRGKIECKWGQDGPQ